MRTLVMVAALAALPLGQTRDAGVAFLSKGKASVAGTVVVDDAAPVPAGRTRVTLADVASNARATTITDDKGRFVFEGMGGGSFGISASRPGFVSIALGATKPGRAGTPLVVPDGQQVTGLLLHLLRGAVIDGTIRDASGAPAGESTVALRQLRTPINGVPSASVVTIVGDNRTDDRGHYRLFGLAPGDYLVSVDPPRPLPTGRSVRQVTSADIARASGRVPSSAPAAATEPSQALVPAPVYYPGTTLMAAAQPIRLKAGEERAGIDFRLEYASAATVTGSVGRPPGVDDAIPLWSIQLTPIADGLGVVKSTSADRDGRFTFASVPPGSYVLTAEAFLRTSAAEASNAPGHDRWIASREVTVSGRDISGISLTLEAAPVISGRVVFKDGTPTPDERGKLAITVAPLRSYGATAKVAADGTFAFIPVRPGAYRLSLSPALGTDAAVWWLESAELGGRDVTHEPFDVRGGQDMRDLVLTLRKGLASIAGKLIDAAAPANSPYTVIVFTAADGRYTTAAAVRPSTDGRFSFKGLVPGDYRIAAAADVDQSDLLDPSFLESLVPEALTVRLTPNEAKTQDLMIRRPPGLQ